MIRETPALSPTMASRKLQALAFIEFGFRVDSSWHAGAAGALVVVATRKPT